MVRIVTASLASMAALGGCSPKAALSAPGCSPPPAETLTRIIDADNARDLTKVLAEYTDDVVWLPPSRPSTKGIEAIRSSYEGMYATFTPALSITIGETMVGADLAVVIGQTGGVLTPSAGDAVTVHDNFMAALRCEGGRWKVARMMWAPASS